MTEMNLHNIIKQSIKHPSDEFTDKLMEKIALQERKSYSSNWKLFFLTLCSIIIFILSLIIKLPELKLLNYSFHITPLMVEVFSVSFILYEIYEIHTLKQIKSKYDEIIGVESVGYSL